MSPIINAPHRRTVRRAALLALVALPALVLASRGVARAQPAAKQAGSILPKP